MKKTILILVILCTFIVSGCKTTIDSNELYPVEFSGEEYQIVYNVSFFPEEFMSLNKKIGVFHKGDKTKTLVEAKAMGVTRTSSFYSMPGIDVSCLIVSSPGYLEEVIICMDTESVKSTPDDTIMISKYLSSMEGLSNVGSDMILNRECNIFETTIKTMKSPSYTLTRMSEMYSEVIYRICKDKESGVPLSIELFAKADSELSPEETNIYSQKANSFENHVDDSELELPVKFSIVRAGCTDTEAMLALEPYKKLSGQAKIQFIDDNDKIKSEMKLGQLTLEPGKIQLVETNYKKDQKTSTIKFCVNNECLSQLCYPALECLKYSKDADACNQKEKCAFYQDYCQLFDCYTPKKEDMCEKIQKCHWMEYPEGYYCRAKKCSNMKTEEECIEPTFLNCKWRDNQCSTINCYDQSIKSDCQKLKNCRWETPEDRGSCNNNGCEIYTNQADCKSIFNCIWDGQLCQNCHSFKSQNICNSYEACYWQEDYYDGWVCKSAQCYDYKTENDCIGAPINCKWKKSSCIALSCNLHATKTSCSEDNSCNWYVNTSSSGQCVMRGCWDSKTEEECEKNEIGCEWSDKGYESYCINIF